MGEIPADITVGDYEINDAIWTDFVDFLDNEEFTYESIGELRLKDLQESASDMDYLDAEDLNQILDDIKARKDHVLESEKKAISEYLSDYLIQRKYSMPGALERGLQKDEVIARAAEIVLNPQTLSELLSVTL
jgi:hypothetical protein